MRKNAYLSMLLVLGHASAMAQETIATLNTKSGYETVPEVGGPTSTPVSLKRADNRKETAIPAEKWSERLGSSWYSLKRNLNENRGAAIGINYNSLAQWVDNSPEESQAAAGIFEFLGAWTLTGRGSDNTSSLIFLLEHQHRIGSGLTPEELGSVAGSALPTGQFGDHGWNLANLYWSQKIRDGQTTIAAGVIDTVDYVNYFPLNDPLTAFSNAAFAGTPTIALPDQGLGAMMRFGRKDLYLSAGFADANAEAGSFDYGGIFEEGELFSHVEVGWTPSYAERFINNIHVTAWHVDDRDAALQPEDWGIAISFTSRLSDAVQPFIRAGISQGTVAELERSISAGVSIARGDFNLLGIGLNWGRQADNSRDQYTAEIFYRFQLLPGVTLTPDVQLILDPILNPDEARLLVLGLRIRVTF